MVTHLQIWRALDALALRHGTSPSGLAKLAGLDPTTFNKSKRGTANGKLRWPSTESLAKVLAATGASLEDIVALASDDARHGRTRPNPNGWSAHLFLHWVDRDGPYADKAFDGNLDSARPVNFSFR